MRWKREKRRFSHLELAEMFGVHPRTISRWLKREKVDERNLIDILAFLRRHNNKEGKPQ